VGVNQRPEITFSAVSWDRQLFCKERLTSRLPPLAAKKSRIRTDVCDVNAVRPAIAASENTAVGLCRAV
jgi:hypothetical protein